MLSAGSNRLGLPGIKPLGPVKIDPSHPLANGMFDCIIWNNDGRPFNLTTGQDVSLTGSPIAKMTVDGPAGETAGSSYTSPDHGNMAAAGDLTVRVRFVPNPYNANTYNTLVTKATSGGGIRELGIFLDQAGQVSYVEFGGGNFNGVLAAGHAASVGLVCDLVITRTAAGSGQLYLNGVAMTAGTFTAAGTTAVPGAVLSFGHDSGNGGVDLDANYLAFNFWQRVLSPDEIALLNADPYGFLLPAEGEMPALLTVGASSGSGSLTQAAGGGVAGTIGSSVATGTLPQAAGTGIARGVTPSISVGFSQGVGIGVAGALSPAVAELLAQASGTGTAGTIAGQVTGGTLSKTLPAAVGIGVAGVITAFSSTAVVATPGGNGGVKSNKKAKPVNFMPVERKGAPKPKVKAEAKAIAPKPEADPGLDTTLVPNDPAPPSLDPVVAPAAPRKPDDLSRFGITTEPPSDLANYAMAEKLLAQLEHDEQPIRDTILATIKAIKADIESDLIGA